MNDAVKSLILVGCVSWLALIGTSFGAIGGVGREGTHVVEIIAGPRDVEVAPGRWTIGVPKALGPVLAAAGVKTGDAILLPDQGREAVLQKTESGWRTLSLTLKIPVGTGPVHAAERMQILPWETFGESLKKELLAAGEGEAACAEFLERVLDRIRTVFGGADMVTGFPGTAYEREFRKAKHGADSVIRVATARGWKLPERVRDRYRRVFVEDWPSIAAGRIWSAGEGNIEIREVRDGAGNDLPGIFSRELPLQADGAKGLTGLFPRGEVLQIRYGRADGEGEERALQWRTAEDGAATWFVLDADREETARPIGQRVENRSEIGVRAMVAFGEREIAAPIPPNGAVELCLALPEGVSPQIRAEGDPEQVPHPGDYHVGVRMADGRVVVESTLKHRPELILNNAEMMAVDVDVASDLGNGRMGHELRVRLGPGEMGYGIPATPHRAMELTCRYGSEFHKDVRLPVAPLGYGDRSNLVLKAERKGNPEVVVKNGGPFAVRLTGMATPAEGVEIQPGQTATVTVPAGSRTVLEGMVAAEEYRCEPIELAAMAPGAKATATVRMVLKAAPKVVLRNTLGMMDVTATLVAASGKPMASPVEVKKGAESPPLSVPVQEGLQFRLEYRNGRFTARGQLDVPVIPRGEVKVLDIPDPMTEIRVQPEGAAERHPVAAPSPAAGSGVLLRSGE